MITDVLINALFDDLQTYYTNNFNYLAVGTGTTAPSSSDTALGNEVLRKARQEYVRDDTNKKFTVSMWISTLEANGNDLTEVGVLDTNSGGNLFTREIFDAISKTSDIEIWIDVEYTTEVSEG